MTGFKGANRPPEWIIGFFLWFSNDHVKDAVLGDLLELYQYRRRSMSKRKADLLFIFNIIQFLQPFATRKKRRSTQLNHLDMFSNYLKIAWRSMGRQKMYSAIKVGGFALGLATCMVIFLFIRHELSYDNIANGDRTYRVYNHYLGADGGKWVSTPANMASVIRTSYPEVEKVGRLIPYQWFDAGSNLVRRDDQLESTFEEKIAYADNDLLDVLDIPLIYGDRSKALTQPRSVVISKKKADKYFPNENPIGKMIVLNDDKTKVFTIGGVMEDFPANRHIDFDFFLTLANVEFWKGEQDSWCCWNYDVYLRLRPDANPHELEQKLLSIKDTYYVGYLKETGNTSMEDVQKNHTFKLQPIDEVYLAGNVIGDNHRHGDIKYVWMFGAVAVFILLLACINFINLSTAKSANRAKEVGLRKVVGSFRSSLIRQFLTESLLYSFVSFGIAILIMIVALPFFNSLAGKTLTVPWFQWWFFPSLIASAVLIGFIAGMYPSFYLSAFKPIDVLKGRVSRGSKSGSLRGAMVVFQFTTSIILIIGTFVIYKQMSYILNAKIGFNKEQVLMIQGANTLNKNSESFKIELSKLAGVEHVTISNYLPVHGTHRDQNGFWREGKTKEEKSVGAQAWWVDEDYLATMGIKLLEGRNFSRSIASDSSAVIINQAMVKALGIKDPLSEKVENWKPWKIIGVVEDFHFEPMTQKIGPLAFMLGKGGSVVSVKVSSDQMTNVIEEVTRVWKTFLPNQPIRYTFLDESYARMYDDVNRAGRILTSFSVLAIVVACLGLFALSAFMVEQRNKEISIRLVLGASMNSIFKLLTQNFVIMVVIAFVIAVPIGWYLMQKWLDDFEYKITLTWDIFAVAGLVSLVIALLTVSYQSIKAALINPAQRLKQD
ncbi:MAG: ABC transporter permease [Bacteroidota bacterium]